LPRHPRAQAQRTTTFRSKREARFMEPQALSCRAPRYVEPQAVSIRIRAA